MEVTSSQLIVMFSANDILGVTRRHTSDSIIYDGISMAVLGYSETPVCYSTSTPARCNATMFQEKQPYIAIETGER